MSGIKFTLTFNLQTHTSISKKLEDIFWENEDIASLWESLAKRAWREAGENRRAARRSMTREKWAKLIAAKLWANYKK